MVQHFRCKQATCHHAKSSMLQENKRDAAYMYVHISLMRTLIDRYLVCCFVQGGLRCCAVLCFTVLAVRFNDIHTRTYLVLRKTAV